MLKITLHDSARELRIQLEGRLSGPWVAELRQCWRTAASTTVGRPTVVDLRDVDFVDSPGESLLADMHRAGVRLEASTPLIDDLVRSICAGRCATVEENWHSSNAVVCPDTSGPRSRAL